MGVENAIENNHSVFTTNNVTTFVIFVTTFLLIYYNTRRRPGTPPGPPLLPIVGNLFSFAGGDVLKTLRTLRDKYGDIFALYIGTELTVFLNGHEVLNDALIKKGSHFLRRPYSNFHKIVVQKPGIIYQNGDIWKSLRALVMKSFNTLFFRNNGRHVKMIIEREAQELIKELEVMAEKGVSFDLDDLMLVSSANVISDLLFKRRFEFQDEIFLGYLRSASCVASELGKSLVLCSCFPFAAKLPGDLLRAEYARRSFENTMNGLESYVEAAKGDENTFIGLLFREMEENASLFDTVEDKNRLFHTTIHDLLAAGSETTSTTILWAILYMLKHPNIQERMFGEICRIKQNDRVISPEYTKQLPYSNAVIYETIRIAPAAQLAVPRSVPRDLNFRGYLLPENCTIVTNLNSSLMDPDVWKDPETFRPERFLNKSETEVVIPRAFLPFSIGQRSCAGESLARMELFMFITSIVANFKLIPCDDNAVYDTNGILGLTWHPKPFELKILKRNTT